MKVAVERRTRVPKSARVLQVSGAFDVPLADEQVLRWDGDLPIDDPAHSWDVGLIVGPSGCGKTSIATELFGAPVEFDWTERAVIDDLGDAPIDEITAMCGAVGFNTIPAWMRPFRVLSNGEQFRATIARHLLASTPDVPIVVDEYTSVVDRQVARIVAHQTQKWVRANGRRFIAVSCHSDIIEWLQPDWILEPATMTFTWRSRSRRPSIPVTVSPVDYAAWRLFARFHYLTAELHRAARCFVLFAGDEQEPAAFGGVLHRPHRAAPNIKGLSRLVTIPDWQGLGLAFRLSDTLAAAYKAHGQRFHTYPAHPALIRSFAAQEHWRMVRKPTMRSRAEGPNARLANIKTPQGTRPCAVFEWTGPAMDQADADRLLR